MVSDRSSTAQRVLEDPCFQAALARDMGEVLEIAPERARRVALDWVARRRRSILDWESAAMDPLDVSIERASRTRIEIPERVACAFEDPSKGCMLTTIHMGDYLHALYALLSRVGARRVVITRRRPVDAVEASILGKLGKRGFEIEVLRPGGRRYRAAIHSVSRGGLIIMFHDLPGSWGSTVDVNVLGRSGALVSGPARLALASGATLIPCLAYDDVDAPRLRLFDRQYAAIDSGRAGNVRAITQGLANDLTRAVRERPSQWHHWPLLRAITQVGGCRRSDRPDRASGG